MRKVLNRTIRRKGKAGTLAADIKAVVAGNVGGQGETSASSSRQRVRIVQRRGRIEDHRT